MSRSQDVLLLASASPQRRHLLGRLGLTLEVRSPDADELDSGDATRVAATNAARKLDAVAATLAGGDLGRTVLACDTVVGLPDGTILGKPADVADARRMLELLADGDHVVTSAVAIATVGAGGTLVELAHHHEQTGVSFTPIDSPTMDWYLATGQWQGRAGGYAIQESAQAFVAGIHGDVSNVIGLPLPWVAAELARRGCFPPTG